MIIVDNNYFILLGLISLTEFLILFYKVSDTKVIKLAYE